MHMRTIILSLALMLASISALAGELGHDLAAIDEAARQNDVAGLEALRQARVGATPDYRDGYLYYTLSIAQQVAGDEKAAEQSLAEAIDLLEEQVDKAPESAEAWALLSGSYGMMIGYRPFRGAVLGPRADRAVETALKLEPDNPRAALIMGIALYSKPRMWGGDKREAIEWLTRAIAAFNDAPAGDIPWGHSNAYIWRAKSHYDVDEPGLALADLDAALAVAPDNAWAGYLKSQIESQQRVAGGARD